MSDRYANMTYRRAGRSGVLLPSLSLGLWHNFGDDVPIANQRAVVHRAFDLGITHFDLANNYGPPYGSAEENFGRLLSDGFDAHRDEILISTKAGWDMWPGPYGDHGSRKYLLASLDQSLRRLGVDYVDIFYSHRPDSDTPLEETMGALHSAVQQGKALYVGISSYGPKRTRAAALLLRELGTPLLIHQPSYSMLNRWIETALLDELAASGALPSRFSLRACSPRSTCQGRGHRAHVRTLFRRPTSPPTTWRASRPSPRSLTREARASLSSPSPGRCVTTA